MADQAPTGPSGDQNPPPRDLNEILEFLTEQAKSNREVLNEQAKEDRNLLKHTLWVVSAPVILALGIAGFFGVKDWLSLDQKAKDTMQETSERADRVMDKTLEETEGTLAEQQRKNGQVLEELREKDRAIGEAEIAKADKTLKDRFSDPNIQSTMEVEAAKAIDAKKMALLDKEVHDKLDPILARASTLSLIADAQDDDASAFDALLALRDSKQLPQDQQEMVSKAIDGLHRTALGQVARAGQSQCSNLSSGKADLASEQGVIAACIGNAGSKILDELPPNQDSSNMAAAAKAVEDEAEETMKIALHDPSLLARAQAVNTVNYYFRVTGAQAGRQFDLLDFKGLKKWWDENKTSYPTLALLAWAQPGTPQFDRVSLYNLLGRSGDGQNTQIAASIARTRGAMRKAAGCGTEDQTSVAAKTNSEEVCAQVGRGLEYRARYGGNRGGLEIGDFTTLMACPRDPKVLQSIEELEGIISSLKVQCAYETLDQKWKSKH